MRLRLPPKSAYPHTIAYKAKIDEDMYSKPVYDEPVTIEYVRFDAGYQFSQGGNNSTETMPNALVSMFERYTDSLPQFEVEDLVAWNDKDYQIVAVIPLYFDKDVVIGYELEVK